MNISSAMSAYKSHDLNIAMKTSSGDTISLDFSNKQSLEASTQQGKNGSSSSLSFSSMQSFQFSMDTNGIDEQDKKEIAAFMKIAQPYIDNFLGELANDAPSSPVTKIANDIVNAFAPMQEKDTNTKNYVKANMVEMFDNAMKKLEIPPKSETSIDKIFEQAQKLLEETLKTFEDLHKKIYA
ncbi:MAG: hypothetical protein RBR59_06435 [Sulfurimonadaceae bacterium]|jgi:hypothetical protein|nr:hypothetical protein [Sulfurimonadaceae bacterium]